jgi:CBS domain-containing protein
MPLIESEARARDIMTAEPVCVTPSTGIRALARLLEEHEVSGAPVVDQNGRVVGVVSRTDLVRRCMEGDRDVPPAYLFEILAEQGQSEEDGGAMPEPPVCVEDFMTEDPILVRPEVSAAAVARLMVEHRVHRVIVADSDRFPLGIITSLDALKAFPAPRK